MNFYGTQEYLDFINDLNKRLFSKIDFSKTTREKDLGNGYMVRGYYYADEENKKPGCAAEGCEICRLFYKGEFVYEWKNTYDESRLSTIVHHSNGNDYLVFDEGLYGYSVLNLNTGEDMHYIPTETAKEDCPETFIWCDCHYNPETDQLAVEGCYWACPYSVIIVDFSNPRTPVEYKDWTDVYAENDYEIDFVRWEGNNLRCRIEAEAELDPAHISGNVILDQGKIV